jgi:hypothetical protein
MVTIHVTGKGDGGPVAEGEVPAPARYGKITFVDLAGSERLQQTESEGAMRAESGAINRSLFALGKVVGAIATASRAEHAAWVPCSRFHAHPCWCFLVISFVVTQRPYPPPHTANW